MVGEITDKIIVAVATAVVLGILGWAYAQRTFVIQAFKERQTWAVALAVALLTSVMVSSVVGSALRLGSTKPSFSVIAVDELGTNPPGGRPEQAIG